MFNYIAFFISMFGCINWMIIGLFQFDVVAGIFGSQAAFVSRFIYCVIGLCALYILIVAIVRKGHLYTPKPQSKNKQLKNSPKTN